MLNIASEDRVAVEELLHCFTDALDDRDWTLLRSLFVDDATSDWFGVRSQTCADDIVGYIRPIFDHLSKTHHILGAFRTTVEGDTAEVRSKGRAYHAGRGDTAELFEESLCEYRIRAVRTPEGWRIAHLAEKLFVMLGTDAVFRRPEGGTG